MIPHHIFGLFVRAILVIILALFLCDPGMCASSPGKGKRRAVCIVFFFSKECEHCESAALLLKGLKKAYPIRLKKFDIGNSRNYELFKKLEAIHSRKGFAVPLIMVGDKILMGERDIKMELESTVRKLARSGGAPFPYLGPDARPQSRARKEARIQGDNDCHCDQRRPPTLGEEWKSIRALVDRYL